MDNNDHTTNAHPTPATGSGDTGPAVRTMSPQVRAHARGTLLAETSRTNISGAAPMGAADGVSFGRDGVDDAPTPLKKRWMVVAAGLAVVAAGAAIIAGTGLLGGDDLGTGPAGTDPSDNNVVDGSQEGNDLSLVRAKAGCTGDDAAPSGSAVEVLYEHQTADYAMVAVTSGGLTQMCNISGNGGGSYSSSAARSSDPVTEMVRMTEIDGDNYTETLGGKVTEDVTKVEILSGGQSVATAHLDNTWFSAFAITAAGEELSYRVTLNDDTTKDVVVENPMYQDPRQRQNEMDENTAMFAQSCFGDFGIALAQPPSDGDAESQLGADEYELLHSHLESSYLASFAANGAEVSACTSAMSDDTWGATQQADLPPGAPIAPFTMSPAPTEKGPYPVLGQAAPNVISVDVIRADGKRRETVLENGFYSLMLPATEAEGLSYVVYTDDGESTTISSE